MNENNAYKAPASNSFSADMPQENDLMKMPFGQLKKLYYRSCNVGAIAALIILGMIGVGFALTQIKSGDEQYLVIILGAMCVFNFIAVIGIIMRTNWGRIMGIIVSCIMLIRIPIGTIIGIFGLFAFIKAKELFGPTRIKHGALKAAFKSRKALGEK